MNKQQFDILSKDRIIHTHLVILDELVPSNFGSRSYGSPTVCRFQEHSLTISDYFSHEALLELDYTDLERVEFSLCSRLTYAIPYAIYYGRLTLLTRDSRRFVLEFNRLRQLLNLADFLAAKGIPMEDSLGLVDLLKERDDDSLYQWFQENVSGQPVADDLI